MMEEQFEVIASHGFHARPAAMLAKLAAQYKSNIHLCSGDNKANAKSVMSIMGLALAQGAQVRCQVEGVDEGDALGAIREFFQQQSQSVQS